MPHPHYIENLLDLKDTNIEVLHEVEPERRMIRGRECKVIHARLSPPVTACPVCGSLREEIIKHGTKPSMIKINQVTGVETYLQLKKQRYYCKACQSTFTATTKLVEKGCVLSKPLKMAILLQAQRVRSEKDIARDFGVSHQTVHRLIHQRHFQVKSSFDYLPSFLGFDEFKSVKSARGAMSFILCDAYNKELIDIVEDRRLPSFIQYFHRFDLRVRSRVRGIVIDMVEPYIQLIKQCFPKAEIIIDRFHVVQHLSRAMNKIRIQTLKRFHNQSLEYRLLKRHWQLLLKPREDLSDRYYRYRLLDQLITHRELVERILSIDEELQTNWLAYQNLLMSFRKRDEKRFFHWLDEYRKHLHPHLNTVIETFHKLSPAIRNSFRTNLTNGIVEGMNNKIKLIKRVSYGYRSFLNFRTRIMLCFTLTKKTAQPQW